MEHIIKTLPVALANQIAAGEVVQRPASIIKETLENAIDAQSTTISVYAQGAGKQSIHIIDDGIGMSASDALSCFERHTTSKIQNTEDLFNIQTLGFRGEAMASIAAVAHVELKTRRAQDELGTKVRVEGGKVVSQEPCSCPKGTQILVSNLFYNVPARRNFLKSNSVELKHIIDEFQRVALSNYEIEMSLFHNNKEIHKLKTGKLAKRIISLLGKGHQEQLITCEGEMNDLEVMGYIGKPEFSKKTRGEQFFFINGRFVRHPYLHFRVMGAYEGLIPSEHYPFYALFINTPPKNIDINIHPTKTEVKFEDERAVATLTQAVVRQSIGSYGLKPSLDFNDNVNFSIEEKKRLQRETVQNYTASSASDRADWKKLYEVSLSMEEKQQSEQINTNSEEESLDESVIIETTTEGQGILSSDLNREETIHFREEDFQVSKEKSSILLSRNYWVYPIKSGMMFVNSRAAGERVLYEYFIAHSKNQSIPQKLLFPVRINAFNSSDLALLEGVLETLERIGIRVMIEGTALIVLTIPTILSNYDIKEIIESFLEKIKQGEDMPRLNVHVIAKKLTFHAIGSLHWDTEEKRKVLIERLMSCKIPHYSPRGEKTIHMMYIEDIEELFKSKSNSNVS